MMFDEFLFYIGLFMLLGFSTVMGGLLAAAIWYHVRKVLLNERS